MCYNPNVKSLLQIYKQFKCSTPGTRDKASATTFSRRNARWLEFLSQFTFEIEHIKGRENVVADALSRVPGVEHLNCL